MVPLQERCALARQPPRKYMLMHRNGSKCEIIRIMYIVQLFTSEVLLVIAIKLKARYRFREAVMIFYFAQWCYPNKTYIIF
jgi:hypothetical protein